jgi:WD40 repeat protein
VSGSGDQTVRLWDAATGAPLQTLEGHTNSVSLVAFSPNGKPLPTLLVKDKWVVEEEANILWLPPEYRPICTAVWHGSLVLACLSGKIAFFHFTQGLKLII